MAQDRLFYGFDTEILLFSLSTIISVILGLTGILNVDKIGSIVIFFISGCLAEEFFYDAFQDIITVLLLSLGVLFIISRFMPLNFLWGLIIFVIGYLSSIFMEKYLSPYLTGS